jgi:acetylornithine deacetylase/succinyl-diaminopimelate desuccinylase-like protein
MSESAVAPLLAELIRCDSTNPDLVPGGVGEGGVAEIVGRRLELAGLEVEVTDVVEGRPNVVGRLPGSGGGRSLLLCSHTDVVGADAALFEPTVADGRMLGRGAIDMKAGLAASIVAAERIAASGPLPGDLIVAGVIDEEYKSLGAVELAARIDADAAILPEQSDLQLITSHGGFAWLELTSIGFEAAGIDVDRGIDSIALLAPVLERISALDRELETRPPASYGRPSIHASTIEGGSQLPAYPGRTVLGIERCTVPGETYAGAIAEIEEMIAAAKRADPRFEAELELIVGRDPVELASGEPIVEVLDGVTSRRLGHPAVHRGDMGWMDSGILVETGVPCVVFGPTGAGEHTDDEWVEIASLDLCAEILEETARSFCAEPEEAGA